MVPTHHKDSVPNASRYTQAHTHAQTYAQAHTNVTHSCVRIRTCVAQPTHWCVCVCVCAHTQMKPRRACTIHVFVCTYVFLYI